MSFFYFSMLNVMHDLYFNFDIYAQGLPTIYSHKSCVQRVVI